MVEEGSKDPHGERETFSKHRVSALSDGIFSIAMTLLVLDLKPPVNVPHGQLWAALQRDSSAWGSFILTFAIAAKFWRLQHRVLDQLELRGQSHLPDAGPCCGAAVLHLVDRARRRRAPGV